MYCLSQESEHLQKLIAAIHKVDSSYMYIGQDLDDLQVERCFAYELYHQWRKLISKKTYKQNYPDIILNGEISKSVEGSSTTYPDMVLHSGQNRPDGNYIVCEIKRNKTTNNAIIDDIIKLSKYLEFTTSFFNNKLQTIKYHEAAFIMFGIESNELKENLILKKTEIDADVETDKQKKINIISVLPREKRGNIVYCDNLNNILG